VTFSADYFSDVAAKYAAYRPTYPAAVVAYLREVAHGDTAWDIGCGSGQLTMALVERFDRVIATDPAPAQLAEAPAHPRVEYKNVAAEDSGLTAGSIDLAVAAQAAHWFDWPRFVVEVSRVTHPDSIVALVGYGNPEVAGDGGAMITEFIEGIAGPYWPAGRAHINNGYRDLVLPWPLLDTPEIDMAVQWTRDELLGYASSWSATNRLRKARGPEAFETFCRELAARWPDDERRRVAWPLLLKVARVTS
jgi:ubiquinone/menaquinone biosynthesis C-methylase UbiE